MGGDKAARRAAKAAARQARAAAADQALGDLPIIWFERSGPIRYHQGFDCEADHQQWHKVSSPDWPEPRPEPISCAECGAPASLSTIRTSVEMRRPDTGEIVASHRDLPAGAVWEAFDLWGDNRGGPNHNWTRAPDRKGRRYRVHRPGADGRVLACMLPDRHEWIIDSRANNCGLPLDDEHWCWCRSGRPEDGTLNVDKAGRTCSAGAGSIASSGYHGFLRHGRLVRC